MSFYSANISESPADSKKVGVLLVNLGTPDAPTTPALRRYLKEFLSDPRVVEFNRPLWWLILNLIILNTRPAKSAHAYQSVWTESGSPLLDYGLKLTEKLRKALPEEIQPGRLHLELAMTYGNPSIASGMDNLRAKGCEKILVLPLYPQYSGSTTAAVTDVVFKTLQSWRRVPDLRVLTEYHDHVLYIEALANTVREHWEKHGRAEKLLMSFHGIPKRYYEQGDPYPDQCRKTAELLAQALHLNEDEWQLSFQSVFGKEEWMKPYTSEQLKSWGGAGLKTVDVICPGFAADCLETLEEIQVENRDYFVEAGGEELRYIAALNDRDDHVKLFETLIHKECSDWLQA